MSNALEWSPASGSPRPPSNLHICRMETCAPISNTISHLARSSFRNSARWRALAHIRDRRVLVTDIATRNFLLDTDLSVVFCDFNNASLLPAQTDMETADDDGYTVAVDIGLLGGVMYEIVTGSKCEIDLYNDNEPTDGRAHWPKRADLPSTENLWLGSCTGGFRDAHSLWHALEEVDQQHTLTKAQSLDSVARSIWSCIQERLFALTAICGFALCVWMKQRGVNRQSTHNRNTHRTK